MINRIVVLIALGITILVLNCCTKETERIPGYKENDTIVYLRFDGSINDESTYHHQIKTEGEVEFMIDKDGSENGAAFFDGKTTYLSFELQQHEQLEFDFWFSPYRIIEGVTVLDYMDGIFSVTISDIDTTYVDAYSAATFAISAVHHTAGEVSRHFEYRPYPMDLVSFDENSKWKHVKIFFGNNSKPVLYINGFEVGYMDIDIPSFSAENATILIGTDIKKQNFFHGKVDELIIRNYAAVN